MAAGDMAGTMGAGADISLQMTAKQGDDGRRVAAVESGYLGNPVVWVRVGEAGNQSGSFAADLLQEQTCCFPYSIKCRMPRMLAFAKSTAGVEDRRERKWGRFYRVMHASRADLRNKS
jgi:hypothetical protein